MVCCCCTFALLTHSEGDRSTDEVYSTGAPLPVHPRLLRRGAVRVVEVHREPDGAICFICFILFCFGLGFGVWSQILVVALVGFRFWFWFLFWGFGFRVWFWLQLWFWFSTPKQHEKWLRQKRGNKKTNLAFSPRRGPRGENVHVELATVIFVIRFRIVFGADFHFGFQHNWVWLLCLVYQVFGNGFRLGLMFWFRTKTKHEKKRRPKN